MSVTPNGGSARRPADYSSVSATRLLADWHEHLWELTKDRYGLGTAPAGAELARHAVEALATGQALTDHIQQGRWVTVASALAYGAPLDHVAAAMSLEPAEVRAGLASWAARQLAHNLITPAHHDEVCALLERTTR